MLNGFSRAMAAVSGIALATVMNTASAQAAPLPDFCVASSVVDNVCTVRLTTVTADVVNGTITGPPVGGDSTVPTTAKPSAPARLSA